MLRRALRSRAALRPQATRAFSKKVDTSHQVLRPIHFEHDEDVRGILAIREGASTSKSLSINIWLRSGHR
jgi:hypothetical protein